MIVSGWKTGAPNIKTGVGFGLKIKQKDRDKYFQIKWPDVKIELEKGNWVEVNLSDSFWRDCIELRNSKIGRWMLENGLAPWPKGNPPKLELKSIGDRKFKLKSP